MAQRLDLVCGPANPLPESAQSFRLTERLGAGGQADVFKAVRQSAGVSSAPVTVKVFRPSDDRPIDAQFRSWDKGDAVLMDLGGRAVPGICRRIDAFYGPPPHHPGQRPPRNHLPYQVLDYLPGLDLSRLLPEQQRGRIDGVGVLRTVADVLDAMHRPDSPEVHPSLHMDVKPSNVMILPSGHARIIDFTGARYHSPSHMTTIAYTPEAAGPEARDGWVGPSYDVHGFGSVAFFLVTGVQPRSDSPGRGRGAAGLTALRRHPALDADPRLRDHLLAPLADIPGNRPLTVELHGWIDQLAALMRASQAPGLGVDWSAPAQRRHVEAPTRLEGAALTAAMAPQSPAETVASTSAPPRQQSPPGGGAYGRGVAAPSHERFADPETAPTSPPAPESPKLPWRGPGGRLERLSGGGEFTVVGVLFAFVCWGIWAIDNSANGFGDNLLVFILVIAVAAGVFTLARLTGYWLLERTLGKNRQTARMSHLASGAFLFVIGMQWLSSVSFIRDIGGGISDLL